MPQPLNFIALTITIITIYTYLKCPNPNQVLLRQWRQTHSMSNAGDNASYTAPLLGCDGPEDWLIKDSYQVFLHKGHSLDQHKKFVGSEVDFDSALRSIFNEQESHGLIYSAMLDNDGLAAVRADFGVDLVACDTRVEADI